MGDTGRGPVGYIRVSGKTQDLEGTSLETQEQQIRAYCAFRELGVPIILTDARVSGGITLDRRPAGSRLNRMIEAGEAGAVIITKLDRGFRSASDCLNNVEAWDELKVSLHILNLGGTTIDTGTPAGKFFLTVMAGAAELELNITRERCREGRRVRISQGALLGGLPYGWDVEMSGKVKLLVKNDYEQGVIETILGLMAQGWKTYGVAKELNRTGARSKMGGGWTPLQVQRVFDKHVRDLKREEREHTIEASKDCLDLSN